LVRTLSNWEMAQSMADTPDEVECWAYDYQGNIRGKHKPLPAVYDGKPATSCAWCGYFLDTHKAVDFTPEV